ncbi:VWA domain-containing protein [Candidatus Woesearchaeota archaeon]|nr:VWA domain-containing protein [Candidatus Woesearchaeota archaeon]
MLTFQSAGWLWLLFAVPAIYLFYFRAKQKKKKQAIKFSHLAIIKKSLADRKRLPRIELLFYLSLLALAFMLIGLADPHIPLEQTKEGVNVVLVIDDSGSMQADDYKPTRLEAAKSAAEILIKSLKPKDHIGIVLFESGATTASYLTPFKERALEKLRNIAPKEGKTAIGDGLSLAVDMATSIPNKKKVIILLSDGVNNAGVISPAEAVAFAKANKIQVYTIGMGSEGKVVLGYDWFGNPQYAELDEATLKAIARETGAKYFKSVDEGTLEEIYRNISEDIEREKEPASIKDWFFAAAILMLIAQIYMRYGRKRIIQ